MLADRARMRSVATSAEWYPTDLLNCQVWLDANRITGLVDGDAVATWYDFSGGGRNATGGISPIYKTNIINSRKPVVRFNGSTQYLTLPATTIANSTAVSMFAVTRTAVVQNHSLFGMTYGALGHQLNLHLPYGEGTLYWDYGRIGVNGRISVAWGGVVNTPYIWCGLVGSGMAFRRNGAQIVTSGSQDSLTINTYTVYLGSISTTGNFFSGDIAELIIYSRRVTTDEIALVESYLSRKYNISI